MVAGFPRRRALTCERRTACGSSAARCPRCAPSAGHRAHTQRPQSSQNSSRGRPAWTPHTRGPRSSCAIRSLRNGEMRGRQEREWRDAGPAGEGRGGCGARRFRNRGMRGLQVQEEADPGQAGAGRGGCGAGVGRVCAAVPHFGQASRGRGVFQSMCCDFVFFNWRFVL